MANTSASYILQCRRLLHDATAQFYSDSELNDYINDARLRVVRDTGCLRKLIQVTVNQGTEFYPYANFSDPVLPAGQTTIDVLNINVIWGNSRLVVDYLPWSRFNYWLRGWTMLQGRPIVFSNYGQNAVYLGPAPDQTYVTEWDLVMTPLNFTSPADITVDTIPIPYQNPVPYYACFTAKQRMQEWDESDRFFKHYKMQIMSSINSAYTRRLSRVI
jgi:hypothetical protein